MIWQMSNFASRKELGKLTFSNTLPFFKGIGKHRSASIAPPRYARYVVKTKNPMCKAKLVGRKSRYLSVVAKKINEKS